MEDKADSNEQQTQTIEGVFFEVRNYLSDPSHRLRINVVNDCAKFIEGGATNKIILEAITDPENQISSSS